MSGRRERGPCGHLGEYLIANYWQCDHAPACDGLARRHDCPRCGAAMSPFVAEGIPDGTWHCLPCGRVRWLADVWDD